MGVPIHIAKILTYPEQVTKHNIEKMRQLVINGPDKHPGANFVTSQGNESSRKFLKYGNRQEAAKHLKPGDKVENPVMTTVIHNSLINLLGGASHAGRRRRAVQQTTQPPSHLYHESQGQDPGGADL